MMNEDYRSAAIRSHYHDRRSQAYSFLQTIASKALVLQETRISLSTQPLTLDTSIFTDSSISLSTMTDEFRMSGSPFPSVHLSGLPPVTDDLMTNTTVTSRAASNHDSLRSDITGLNDEAETRQRIIQQERLRSIRRKILEKNSIAVYKRGRNHKMRLIDIIVQHEKKKETYIMWKSKMNTLKKVEIDHHTQVEILPHQLLHDEGYQHPSGSLGCNNGSSSLNQGHVHSGSGSGSGYGHHGSNQHQYRGAIHHKHRHHTHNTSNSSMGSVNSANSATAIADDNRSVSSAAVTPNTPNTAPISYHHSRATGTTATGVNRRGRIDSQDSSSTNKSDIDSLAGNASQLRVSTSSQQPPPQQQQQVQIQRILLQPDPSDTMKNQHDTIGTSHESGNYSSQSITSLSSAMSYSKTTPTMHYHHHVGQSHYHHPHSTAKPVPFLRLKNRSRYLDLQFLSHVELEAFLLVIQRYANLQLKFDENLLTLTSSTSTNGGLASSSNSPNPQHISSSMVS